MQNLVIEAIARGGYLGIALLMALENIIPPIPSEVIMGVGGVLLARGEMQFWPLMIAGTVGTTAGNYFWYWVGHKCGYQRLEPFVTRYGRWLTLEFEDIERAAGFFRRYGQWVVFGLRFSPFLRTMVSLPAGLAHMSVWRFLSFTFCGAAIWNAILIEGGRRLAPLIARYEYVANWAIGISVVAMVAWYIWRVATWQPRQRDDRGKD